MKYYVQEERVFDDGYEEPFLVTESLDVIADKCLEHHNKKYNDNAENPIMRIFRNDGFVGDVYVGGKCDSVYEISTFPIGQC